MIFFVERKYNKDILYETKYETLSDNSRRISSYKLLDNKYYFCFKFDTCLF